eukprot:COSAG02_NODE_5279_length_4477_cov_2.530151_1_plen_87_part_00
MELALRFLETVPETAKSVPQRVLSYVAVSRNRKVSSTKGLDLRGCHVLRNYLKNKALCAIAACVKNGVQKNVQDISVELALLSGDG